MFDKFWACLCKQLQLTHQEQNQPCLSSELTATFDRTVIKDPKDQDKGMFLNKRSLKVLPMPFTWDVNNLVRAAFVLTREDIKKLRDKVIEISEGVKQSKQLHLSTFVVTIAYVLVCMVKAKIVEGNNINEIVLIGFTAGYRSRLDPPVPLNYFVNCVGKLFEVLKATAVTQENGFVFVAEMLSDRIKRIDADAKVMELVKQGALFFTVAGSTRLEFYGSDFGWGKPKKVEIVSTDGTNGVFMVETKDGGGGFKVGVALEKQEIDVFASPFAYGLKNNIVIASKL